MSMDTSAQGARWVQGPITDLSFFVLSPLYAGVLPGLLAFLFPSWGTFHLPGFWGPVLIGSGLLTQGHVFVGGFRAYANPSVFRRYSTRLIWVPVLAYAAVLSSLWIFVLAAVAQYYWRLFHYARQHAGFCHIYDRKAGRFSSSDRIWDEALVGIVYLLPQAFMVLTLNDMLADSKMISDLGWKRPAFVGTLAQHGPQWIETYRLSVQLFCVAFVTLYFLRAVILLRKGQSISWQKHAFLATLSLAIIGGWAVFKEGFVLETTLILHSIQYYAIVVLSEKRLFERQAGSRFNPVLVGAVVILSSGLLLGWYGSTIRDLPTFHGFRELGFRFVAGSIIVANLLHFWMDGFIWSRPETGSILAQTPSQTSFPASFPTSFKDAALLAGTLEKAVS